MAIVSEALVLMNMQYKNEILQQYEYLCEYTYHLAVTAPRAKRVQHNYLKYMLFQFIKAGMQKVTDVEKEPWVRTVISSLHGLFKSPYGDAMFGFRDLLSLPSNVMSDAQKDQVYEEAKKRFVSTELQYISEDQ